MENKVYTIEDCLESLAGLRKNCNFTLDSSDKSFLKSIANQTRKGISLTDRQYAAVMEKILGYRQQFDDQEFINFDTAIQNLRKPLRSIDRSRWIKIVNKDGINYLAIRFVFSKSLITLIENLRNVDRDAVYDRENKTHYFTLSEKNIFNIVSALDDKSFEIDSEVKEKYNKLLEMKEHKSRYIPGIYKFKLENLNKRAIDYIITDAGEPNKNNLSLFKDRSRLYGIDYFDEKDLDESLRQLTDLSQKIVRRKQKQVLIDAGEYNFDKITESILELSRFPLLVILNSSTDYDSLVTSYNSFKNVIPRDSFSVLYRKENKSKDDIRFNQYIAENKLNTDLDSNPKVVYINNDKLPKTLLKTNWKPLAAIYLNSTSLLRVSKIASYTNELDFVIHYSMNKSEYMGFELKQVDII